MLKDDIDLSVALEILDRKIANLNLQIVDNPKDESIKNELNQILNTKKEIEKGNIELIERVINSK